MLLKTLIARKREFTSQIQFLRHGNWSESGVWKFTRTPAKRKDTVDLGKNRFLDVAGVRTKYLHKFFNDEMKLRITCDTKKPGIQFLQNVTRSSDRWIVRKNTPCMYYYRLEILSQRIDFIRGMDITPKQKFKLICRNPPTLIYTFDSTLTSSSMVYLRGLVKDDHVSIVAGLNVVSSESDFIHAFYPVSRSMTMTIQQIEGWVNSLAKELSVQPMSILDILMSIPSFYMDPALLSETNHVFIHRSLIPSLVERLINYDSAGLYPPISNPATIHEELFKKLSNHNVPKALLHSLPRYRLTDILDYSYRGDTKQNVPESLHDFLIRANREEFKEFSSFTQKPDHSQPDESRTTDYEEL